MEAGRKPSNKVGYEIVASSQRTVQGRLNRTSMPGTSGVQR